MDLKMKKIVNHSSEAKKYGLSRQTYQLRVKNWQFAIVDGKRCLISKKHCMELISEDELE